MGRVRHRAVRDYEMSREPIYALFQKNANSGCQPYCSRWCAGWGAVDSGKQPRERDDGTGAKAALEEVSDNPQPSWWGLRSKFTTTARRAPHPRRQKRALARDYRALARSAAGASRAALPRGLRLHPDAEPGSASSPAASSITGVVVHKHSDNEKKNYGFIKGANTRAKAGFNVHFSSQVCTDFDALAKGSEVEFTLIDNHGRATALEMSSRRRPSSNYPNKRSASTTTRRSLTPCARSLRPERRCKGLRHVVTCREKLPTPSSRRPRPRPRRSKVPRQNDRQLHLQYRRLPGAAARQ